MKNELEYIKLKVDWFKSLYPWNLALIAGGLAFARFIEGEYKTLILLFIVTSAVFLIFALMSMGFAALSLIHRLEPPYEPKSKSLKKLFWVPHSRKLEAGLEYFASGCLSIGHAAFIMALIIYAAT